MSYATEVTAYVEPCKIKKVTGIRAKELLVWLTVVEAAMNSPKREKITFKTTTGPYITFPTEAFMIEEVPLKKVQIEVALL